MSNNGFDGKLSPPSGPGGPGGWQPPPGGGAPPPPGPPPMGYGYPPPGYGPPGMPPPMGGMYAGPPTTHPLAITSLVCGILSLPVACCCWMVAPALSITALVCGIIGMNKIKAEPERYTGQGLAITGIVLGGVGTAIGVGTFALGMGNALMDKLR